MTQTAIFFHSDAIESEGADLVGRRSAGQSFLRGYMDHVPGDHLRAVTQTKKAAEAFDKVAREMGETRDIRVHPLRGGKDFTEAETIFFPGPGYLDAAWLRERHGPTRASLVGITHTVSTRRIIEGLHNLMLEPVHPWDAIICTSRAVQSVVATQFEEAEAFIKDRFGATKVPLPQLPVIPLGIHAKDFKAEPGHREALRERLGADKDTVVILTMGRLTSVEKANPVPLFLALEQVAKRTGKKIHLWMAGWASREPEEALHRDGAAQLCPSVKTTIIDGRESEIRRHIWSAADIFTLPVDNIQETFGLVPVEAMAAGLPVVLPDWNGFRDTVVDGETGLLVPTRMQGAGLPAGRLAARRFTDGTDGYLHHLSILQQQTVIDVGAYADALEILAKDATLRQIMGQSGIDHVAQTFDWSKVIPQYLELADELGKLRQSQTVKAGPRPLQIDPFHLYRSYPSHQITGDWTVALKMELTGKGLTVLDKLNGRALYQRRVLPDAELLKIAALITAPMTVKDLATLAQHRVDVVQSAVLFLAKYDFVVLKQPN